MPSVRQGEKYDTRSRVLSPAERRRSAAEIIRLFRSETRASKKKRKKEKKSEILPKTPLAPRRVTRLVQKTPTLLQFDVGRVPKRLRRNFITLL